MTVPPPKPYRGRMIMAGIAIAVLVAVIATAVILPGAEDTARGNQTTAQQTLAAARIAADKQWAAATCSNILDWKNAIHHDLTNLDLGFGAPARIRDAVDATTRMLDRLDKLGLPQDSGQGPATADAQQLRTELQTRLRDIQADAAAVASGNLGAIGRLVTDLSRDKAVAPQISNELRHLLTVDLGISLAETHACRELVGIPI